MAGSYTEKSPESFVRAPAAAGNAAQAKPSDNPAVKETSMPQTADPGSITQFQVQTLEGKPANLADYRGKVLLVVNTASQCGYTPQYQGLQALWEQYGSKGLVVIGFPSNDFGAQEPGDSKEIRDFCSTNFHVSFPLMAKVQTKDGAGQSPIYGWLGKATGSLPNWNFCKYLVGKDGKPVAFFPSKVAPDDATLKAAIDKALGTAN